MNRKVCATVTKEDLYEVMFDKFIELITEAKEEQNIEIGQKLFDMADNIYQVLKGLQKIELKKFELIATVDTNVFTEFRDRDIKSISDELYNLQQGRTKSTINELISLQD